MKLGPFWRPLAPLSPAEVDLLNAVALAHGRSVMRQNASSDAVFLASRASGDYTKAIAAALMTLGGAHAPLAETMRVLKNPELSGYLMKSGRKVPGWGNTFVRGEPDPLWSEVAAALAAADSDLTARIDGITGAFHAAGKNIFPNPSAYTAAAALVVGMPASVSPFLFVSSRLEAWSALYLEQSTTR